MVRLALLLLVSTAQAAVLQFGPEVPLSEPSPQLSSPILLNADGALIAIWTDGERVHGRGRSGSAVVLPAIPRSFVAAASKLVWIASVGAGNTILVHRFTPDLQPVDSAPIVIQPATSEAVLSIAMASADDRALVAWTLPYAAPGMRVGAALIEETDVRQLAVPRDDYLYGSASAAVAWDGSEFLLAWMNFGPPLLCSPCPNYGDIFAVHVARDGAVRESAPIRVFSGLSFGFMRVAAAPQGFAVAWSQGNGVDGVILNGATPSPQRRWLDGVFNQYALASRTDDLVAVWTIDRGARVAHRLIDAGGVPAPDTGLFDIPGGTLGIPAVVALGPTVVVAYSRPVDENVPRGAQRIDLRSSVGPPRRRAVR